MADFDYSTVKVPEHRDKRVPGSAFGTAFAHLPNIDSRVRWTRYGLRWDTTELEKLAKFFCTGLSFKGICENMMRPPAGVIAKLIALKLIETHGMANEHGHYAYRCGVGFPVKIAPQTFKIAQVICFAKEQMLGEGILRLLHKVYERTPHTVVDEHWVRRMGVEVPKVNAALQARRAAESLTDTANDLVRVELSPGFRIIELHPKDDDALAQQMTRLLHSQWHNYQLQAYTELIRDGMVKTPQYCGPGLAELITGKSTLGEIQMGSNGQNPCIQGSAGSIHGYKPALIEHKTFILGIDAANMSDAEIFGVIAGKESELKELDKIANKPEKLKTVMAELQTGIEALVAYVDGRK